MSLKQDLMNMAIGDPRDWFHSANSWIGYDWGKGDDKQDDWSKLKDIQPYIGRDFFQDYYKTVPQLQYRISKDTDKIIEVQIPVPGCEQSDLSLSYDENSQMLTLTSKKTAHEMFTQTNTFSMSIGQVENIKSSLKNGLLTVTGEKIVPKSTKRMIEITSD